MLHHIHNNEHEHDKEQKDKIIIFNKEGIEKIEKEGIDSMLKEQYKNRGQRAIGVVYNPTYKQYGNYVPTILSLRYDALFFIDSTNALSPLHIKTSEDNDLPETFPTGL